MDAVKRVAGSIPAKNNPLCDPHIVVPSKIYIYVYLKLKNLCVCLNANPWNYWSDLNNLISWIGLLLIKTLGYKISRYYTNKS